MLISVSNLSKKFFSKKNNKSIEFNAVNKINFQVKKGEIFGLLGTNGAGKSTTIDILTTKLLATTGDIRIGNFDLTKDKQNIRKIIGCVSQKGGSDTSFDAKDNLVLQAQLYGVSFQEALEKSLYFIEKFKLTDIQNRKVSTYSGGQKRRLELAMGLINDPEIIFLDEPTTGLDPQSRSYFWEEILSLKKNGKTIFLTTHYLEEADNLCDTIAIMDQGKIIEIGNPQNLKESLGNSFLRINFFDDKYLKIAKDKIENEKNLAKEINILEDLELNISLEDHKEGILRIMKIFSENDIKIHSINMTQPTLNDLFLKKTGKSLIEK